MYGGFSGRRLNPSVTLYAGVNPVLFSLVTLNGTPAGPSGLAHSPTMVRSRSPEIVGSRVPPKPMCAMTLILLTVSSRIALTSSHRVFAVTSFELPRPNADARCDPGSIVTF